MFVGDKAPFDGVLYDNDTIRKIDIDLMEKDICEQKLYKETSCDSMPGWQWEEFAAGILIGGLIVYAVH